MHQTYELYFEAEEEPPRFEAITCGSEAELMSALRRLLADRGARAVEVRQFGSPLFTLTA